MYKQSIYNLRVNRIEKKILLYNSHSESLSCIENDVCDYLDNLNDNSRPETFKWFKQLKTMGYIVPKDFNEYNFFLFQYRNLQFSHYTNELTYIIAPTTFCNFNCSYCFENGIDSHVMESNTIENLVAYIKKSIEGQKDLKRLNIDWFGGEPLLEKNIIYYISSQIKDFAKKANIDFKASLITNGYYLDEKTVLSLYEQCNISYIQITLDGGEADSCKRKGISGEQFHTILRNLKNAYNFFDMSLRFNTDKYNYESIKILCEEELFLDVHLKEKVSIYIAPITSISSGEQSCLNTNEFSKLKIDFSKFLLENGCYKSVTKAFPRAKYISCGALMRNNFIIDSRGNLYKCDKHMGKDIYIVGNVEKGRNYSDAELVFSELPMLSSCSKCSIYPICRGGCAMDRISSKNQVNCSMKEEEIKSLLPLYFEATRLNRTSNFEQFY